VTAWFEPASVTYPLSNTTLLKVTPGPTTKTEGWTYNLKITGTTASGIVHSITVKLSVTRSGRRAWGRPAGPGLNVSAPR